MGTLRRSPNLPQGSPLPKLRHGLRRSSKGASNGPWPRWWGEMKDLNSPFKMEHFGEKHVGRHQFYLPLAPKLTVPYCHKLVWVGGSKGAGVHSMHGWQLLCNMFATKCIVLHWWQRPTSNTNEKKMVQSLPCLMDGWGPCKWLKMCRLQIKSPHSNLPVQLILLPC